MAGVLQHLRSSTLDKRPNPASMVDGQVAINYASGSPGMFFKDSNGNLVKVGPVHVGSTAPNVSPASGGTAGNSKGEQWLDTSGGTYVFKIWDGAAWRSEAGEFVNTTGDTMTGSLTMGTSANIIFEGSVDDGFETTLTVVNPTADRTITLPNVTGTVVTTGDSGSVTSTMIANGTIVDADVNASAAIAGTKISPNFGSQTVQTTGIFSAAGGSQSAPSIAFTGDTNTGIYSPGADQVAISTNGQGQLFVNSSGKVGVGIASPGDYNSTVSQLSVGNTGGHGGINIVSNSANTGIIRFADGTVTNEQFRGRIEYNHSDDSLFIGTAGSEKLRITSDGKVGLGTSSPTQALDVAGSFKLSGNAILGPAAGNYGQLTADKTSVFSASDAPTSTTLYLTNSSGGTEGNGNYGPSIGFGKINSSLRPGGAIATVQTSSDGDQCGLAFLTHSASVTNNELSEAVRIKHDGKVGIGTASSLSPTAPLDDFHIASTDPAVLLEETDAGVDEKYWRIRADGSILRFEGVNDTFSATTAWLNVTRSAAARSVDTIAFNTGTSERLRITSDGKVGLGTSAPDSTLNVRAGANNTAIEEIAAFARPDNTVRATINKGLSTGNGISFGTTTGQPIAFRTNNTERLYIDNSGYVGVGTSSPDELLHIQGDTAEFKGTNTNQIADALGTEQVFKLGAEGQKNNVYGPAGSIIFRQDGNTWSSVDQYNKPTRIEFCTQNSSISDTSETPRLVIDKDGNVGVGTSSPASLLHLSGANVDTALKIQAGTAVPAIELIRGSNSIFGADTTYDYRLKNEAGDFTLQNGVNSTITDLVTVTATGNVGVGTASPAEKLDVNGTVKATKYTSLGSFSDLTPLQFDRGSVGAGMQVRLDSGGYRLVATDKPLVFNADYSTGLIAFRIDNSEKARIDSSGRLLVGTSSSITTVANGFSSSSYFSLAGSSAAQANIAANYFANNATGAASLALSKSRNTTVGSHTALISGDRIGSISYSGSDGTAFVEAARIGAEVDGTPGTSDMPGRLVFSTTADGASSPTERMRIKSNGVINFSNVSVYADNAAAIAGGLAVGDVYRKSDGTLMIRY